MEIGVIALNLTAADFEKAREEMMDAFAKWSGIDPNIDPNWEELAWAEYQVKVKRYNVMFAELRSETLTSS